jgi:23S rRNA (guanosine2251-2'-O)-methyltransferase
MVETNMNGGTTGEWLYGIIPVLEALRACRRHVMEIWMVPAGRNRRLQEVRDQAAGVPLNEVAARELDKRCQGKRHQGVVARVGKFPWSELWEILEDRGPILLLEGIQDPRNFGAIIRSAVALGIDGVVIERRRSAPLSPVVAKNACGALERVRLCEVANMPRAIDALKRAGYWIAGTGEEGGIPLWEADLPEPAAVLVGGEGHGLRRVVRERCDLWLTIPCGDKMKTLNASVATAVVLYELLRKRRTGTRDDKEGGRP